ncbi:hypothetical protein M5C72_03055 [Companilactobacillus allii]|uniref:Uncharacterized protein n=1 Tax=Companilactobacillus allii TaxID=1847728 RepID=A0A1P8Q2L9_9LACO|nr:hypothetical protein [Companilactobacillus allii]APX72134.1 hypothetical protein BTM29_05980 [Companilactobacillus allii]USQ69232.1 hypothetical protein M5C72_03055 [Companilactobacillus allii]
MGRTFIAVGMLIIAFWQLFASIGYFTVPKKSVSTKISIFDVLASWFGFVGGSMFVGAILMLMEVF